jgi:hypothetical protein
MSQIEINSPAYLRLSVQRSLLGNVTVNLAGLRAELGGMVILIDAYFFNAPSEEDRELVDVAASEVIADYPDGYTVETHLGVLSEIDVKGFTWDFLRSEAFGG